MTEAVIQNIANKFDTFIKERANIIWEDYFFELPNEQDSTPPGFMGSPYMTINLEHNNSRKKQCVKFKKILADALGNPVSVNLNNIPSETVKKQAVKFILTATKEMSTTSIDDITEDSIIKDDIYYDILDYAYLAGAARQRIKLESLTQNLSQSHADITNAIDFLNNIIGCIELTDTVDENAETYKLLKIRDFVCKELRM